MLQMQSANTDCSGHCPTRGARCAEVGVSAATRDTLHPGDGRDRKQWRYSRARLVELFESAL
jgi:hypothetical protein